MSIEKFISVPCVAHSEVEARNEGREVKNTANTRKTTKNAYMAEVKGNSEFYSSEQLRKLNRDCSVFPITENLKEIILLKCQEALIGNQTQLKNCTECDSLTKGVSESSSNFCDN